MKNLTLWICILIWIFITLIRVCFHQPWFDESNAWEIARNLEFGNILDSVKYEGHFLIWYLLLMPFAKLNIGYPYSMLLINWVFCFASIVILWKYSPFNNFVKALITFSFPFLACYPVIARCYSIGILPIFLLCALYKNRLKYPVIYSLIIFFAMNTSIMAIFGASILGLYLIYDLYKNDDKKNFKICLTIAIMCILTTLVQVLNFDTAKLPLEKAFGLDLKTVLSTFVLLPQVINAILLIFFVIGFGIYLFKDKRAFGLAFVTFGALFGMFNFTYAGDFWHYYFLYVYLIVACWIALEQNYLTFNCKKILTILLGFLSLLLVFDFRNDISVYNSCSKDVANYIKSHKNDCSIFSNQIFFMTLPYLRDGKTDYDIKLVDTSNGTYNIGFDFDMIEMAMANSEQDKKEKKEKKENYLYVNSCAEIPNLKKGNKTMYFIKDKNIKNLYCIYKIEIK